MKSNFIKILVILFLLTGCTNNIENVSSTKGIEEDSVNNKEYIVDEINILKIDENNYEFVYNGDTFKVFYIPDTWKIYNSYKITNSNDIKKICKALIDIHPIHGVDMVSYRTEDDMTYEWLQHNLAYQILPSSNSFKNSAKDVDLDPRDQGKNLVEIYEERTGQKLEISKFFN